MDIDFPLHFDRRGRTALAGMAEHVRDMVEQVLMTTPGERVNRPEFGSGLLDLPFEGNQQQLADAVRFAVSSALERWLGDVIEPRSVEARAYDSTLTIEVVYAIRATGETGRSEIQRAL